MRWFSMATLLMVASTAQAQEIGPLELAEVAEFSIGAPQKWLPPGVKQITSSRMVDREATVDLWLVDTKVPTTISDLERVARSRLVAVAHDRHPLKEHVWVVEIAGLPHGRKRTSRFLVNVYAVPEQQATPDQRFAYDLDRVPNAKWSKLYAIHQAKQIMEQRKRMRRR